MSKLNSNVLEPYIEKLLCVLGLQHDVLALISGSHSALGSLHWANVKMHISMVLIIVQILVPYSIHLLQTDVRFNKRTTSRATATLPSPKATIPNGWAIQLSLTTYNAFLGSSCKYAKCLVPPWNARTPTNTFSARKTTYTEGLDGDWSAH